MTISPQQIFYHLFDKTAEASSNKHTNNV